MAFRRGGGRRPSKAVVQKAIRKAVAQAVRAVTRKPFKRRGWR